MKIYVCYFQSYTEGFTSPQKAFWNKKDAEAWIRSNFDEDNEAKFKEINIEGCSSELTQSITEMGRKILEETLNKLK